MLHKNLALIPLLENMGFLSWEVYTSHTTLAENSYAKFKIILSMHMELNYSA